MTISSIARGFFLCSAAYVTGCIAATHEELKKQATKFGTTPDDELLLKRVEEYGSQTFYTRSLQALQRDCPTLSDPKHLAKYQNDKRNLYRHLLQEVYSETFALEYSPEKETALLKTTSKVIQMAKVHIQSLQYLKSTSINIPQGLLEEEAVLAKEIRQAYETLEKLAKPYDLELPKFPGLSDPI